MTERMASGWMTVGEAGYRAEMIRKTQSRWWEATVQLGGDITKESEEMQESRALKEAYEAKGNVAENTHFAVIRRRDKRPITIVISCR